MKAFRDKYFMMTFVFAGSFQLKRELLDIIIDEEWVQSKLFKFIIELRKYLNLFTEKRKVVYFELCFPLLGKTILRITWT